VFFGQPFGGILPGVQGAVLAVLLRTGTPLTGRQIHRLLSEDYSLWSVQQAVKTLTKLGLAETNSVGRAGVTTINDNHAAVSPLREMLSPISTLRDAVAGAVGDQVSAVILFGSIARGEATLDSDIDLAVIAPKTWRGRIELADRVRSRVGNDCDVVVFTPRDFERLAKSGEPVVSDIIRDGIALIGTKPRINGRAA
jgi:predicted nucleotidyltransferase